MSRITVLGLAALVALTIGGAAIGSSSQAHLVVRPGKAMPGAKVSITGYAGYCLAGDTLMAISSAFPGDAFGEGVLAGPIRTDHRFAIRGRLNAAVQPGRYRVTARCGGGNLGVAAVIRVS